jgi:DNA/RNA endonuclease YhcR with UshA esterase domain
MRRAWIFVAGILIAGEAICLAGDQVLKDQSPKNCLTIAEAGKHIGKKRCVTGTVIRVEEGSRGVTFLDFCPDYRTCPFTVVVFASDLRRLGDLRQLQGRLIAIQGRIEEYDERAEIILRHPEQLGEHAAMLTALPKDYDVEKQGHFSAGTFRHSKAKKPKHTRQDAPVPIIDVEEQ